MSYFRYTGYDQSGTKINDNIQADSREDAENILQERGIFVSKIKKGKAISLGAKNKVKVMDIVVFTRLLSTMVNANIPIVDGLEISAGQVPEGRFRQVIRKMINDIKSGLSLSEALSLHPDIFSKLYISMVKAGELSGRLGNILEQLFNFQERMANLKRKVVSALIYPSIVLFVAVTIVVLFLVVLIPMFKENFMQFGKRLPFITRFFIDFSDVFNSIFIYIVIALVLLFIGLFKYIKTPKGRYTLDKIKFKLPLVGGLIQKVVLVRVTRTLGTQLGNGVPIIDAMNIVAEASGNVVMEELLQNAKKRISDGERMAATFAASTIMPKMVIQMISMGEETGHLPEMLDKVAEFYDSDVDIAVDRLTAALTPILIIGLGFFVGLVIVALFLPMFSMSKLAT